MNLPQPLQSCLSELPNLDSSARITARRRFDSIPGSQGIFGGLEAALEMIAATTGDGELGVLESPSAMVVLSDTGIVGHWPDAGFSTLELALTILDGSAPAAVLAAGLDLRVQLFDAGIDGRVSTDDDRYRSVKIRRNTGDFTVGAAMTEDEADDLLTVGVELAKEVPPRTMLLLAGGGRASEVSSMALLASLRGGELKDYTLRPAGFDDIALSDMKNQVFQALDNHRSRLGSPLSALATVGGFEHAVMAGLMAGCASRGCTVLFGSIAAAAAAAWLAELAPAVATFLIPADQTTQVPRSSENKSTPVMMSEMRSVDGSDCMLALRLLREVRRVFMASPLPERDETPFEVDVGSLERTDGKRSEETGD